MPTKEVNSVHVPTHENVTNFKALPWEKLEHLQKQWGILPILKLLATIFKFAPFTSMGSVYYTKRLSLFNFDKKTFFMATFNSKTCLRFFVPMHSCIISYQTQFLNFLHLALNPAMWGNLKSLHSQEDNLSIKTFKTQLSVLRIV